MRMERGGSLERRIADMEERRMREWCRELAACAKATRAAQAAGTEEPPMLIGPFLSLAGYLERHGIIPAVPWERLKGVPFDPADPVHRQIEPAATTMGAWIKSHQ